MVRGAWYCVQTHHIQSSFESGLPKYKILVKYYPVKSRLPLWICSRIRAPLGTNPKQSKRSQDSFGGGMVWGLSTTSPHSPTKSIDCNGRNIQHLVKMYRIDGHTLRFLGSFKVSLKPENGRFVFPVRVCSRTRTPLGQKSGKLATIKGLSTTHDPPQDYP